MFHRRMAMAPPNGTPQKTSLRMLDFPELVVGEDLGKAGGRW